MLTSIKTLGIVCLSAGMLVACGSETNAPDPVPTNSSSSSDTLSSSGKNYRSRLEAEFVELNKKGDPIGELMIAVRDGRPELYNEFLDVAAEKLADGATPQQAGAALRPKFLEEMIKTQARSSNGIAVKTVAFTRDMYKALAEADPQECHRNIQGLPPANYESFPEAIRRREAELLKVTLSEPVPDDIEVATPGEVQTWMTGFIGDYPQHVEAFGMVQMPRLDDASARRVCDASVDMFETLSREDEATQAALFRGLLAMN